MTFLLTFGNQVLDFAYLQSKTKSFLEILLSTAFRELSKRSRNEGADQSTFDSAIASMLNRAKDVPQVITGLHYFLSKEANMSDIASSSSERKVLKSASKTSIVVLSKLSSATS